MYLHFLAIVDQLSSSYNLIHSDRPLVAISYQLVLVKDEGQGWNWLVARHRLALLERLDALERPAAVDEDAAVDENHGEYDPDQVLQEFGPHASSWLIFGNLVYVLRF